MLGNARSVSQLYFLLLGAFTGFCTQYTPGPTTLFKSFCFEAVSNLMDWDKDCYSTSHLTDLMNFLLSMSNRAMFSSPKTTR